MIDWLTQILPFPERFQFIEYITAAVLVVAAVTLIFSIFINIFSAFFR